MDVMYYNPSRVTLSSPCSAPLRMWGRMALTQKAQGTSGGWWGRNVTHNKTISTSTHNVDCSIRKFFLQSSREKAERGGDPGPHTKLSPINPALGGALPQRRDTGKHSENTQGHTWGDGLVRQRVSELPAPFSSLITL